MRRCVSLWVGRQAVDKNKRARRKATQAELQKNQTQREREEQRRRTVAQDAANNTRAAFVGWAGERARQSAVDNEKKSACVARRELAVTDEMPRKLIKIMETHGKQPRLTERKSRGAGRGFGKSVFGRLKDAPLVKIRTNKKSIAKKQLRRPGRDWTATGCRAR